MPTIVPIGRTADGPRPGRGSSFTISEEPHGNPLGDPTSEARLMENLPPPNTKRWVVRRKAAVVAAVRSGAITIEEACHYYQLSEEEFLSWERAFESTACGFAYHARAAISRTSTAPRVGHALQAASVACGKPRRNYARAAAIRSTSNGRTPARARASQKRSACGLVLPDNATKARYRQIRLEREQLPG